MKKRYLYILIVLVASSTYGQQLPQFTQYMYNTISINPAYAGSRDGFSLTLLNRNQWVGLEGAPVTQTLSVNSPLRNDKV
ncbi:MAG: type IX secretion system membrane protein PorP/SprF, partial [Salegentibacter sp.]